jgi:hypothetical protein
MFTGPERRAQGLSILASRTIVDHGRSPHDAAVATMQKYIHMSTTDSVPMHSDRKVVRSGLAWAHGNGSMADADDALSEWAREHGYDAFIGIRYEIVPLVSGSVTSDTRRGSANEWAEVSGETSTDVSVTIYGTAIEWEPLDPGPDVVVVEEFTSIEVVEVVEVA